jgi:membrane protein YdbS with pleckstrin-like domain
MWGLRLIDDAGREFHRLWSIRASVAYGVFATVAGAIGWFADTLNPWLLVAIAIVLNLVVLPALRVIKQREKATAVPPPLPVAPEAGQ